MKSRLPALVLLAVFAGLVAWASDLDRNAPAQSGGVAAAKRAVLAASSMATDLRFALRGSRPPDAKVVVVAIDSESIGLYGRWPWHRDALAALIDAIGQAGATAVGLDMVFSEPDPRTPPALREAMQQKGFADLADAHETDPMLAAAIAKWADRLVLGWQTDSPCVPLRDGPKDCPVADPQWADTIPASHGLFALPKPKGWRSDRATSPLTSAVTVVPNLPAFAGAARHAGFFNAWLDTDGVIRSTRLVMAVAGKVHPSLALAMAEVAWKGRVRPEYTPDGHLAALRKPDGTPLPVGTSGGFRMDFYGPGRSFAYVPAHAVLAGDKAAVAQLAGAHVLIGLTALGLHDMRAFPFDANVAGVEGHATILANLLEGRAFAPIARPTALAGLLAVLIVVGAGISFALHRLDARKGLAVAAAALLALFAGDLALFSHGTWLDTGLVYVGLASVFAVTLALRYFEEQKDRAFVKSAFSRYVSPAVVDEILSYPDQLGLGGQKKALTVLFSDIRSFTTVSERLDPKDLVAFLNRYLGCMTELVFASSGTLDKYIGDAVMAFWGAPNDLPGHARKALECAVAMQRAVAELRPEVKQRWGIDLEIGVGVATGVVSVGNMGSERNLAYTVLGDRVNLAARLESLTKTYGAEVLTTADTLAAARAQGAQLHAREVDQVRVKGKHEPVILVEVTREPVADPEQQAFAAARAMYDGGEYDAARAAFDALYAQTQHRLYRMLAERCTLLASKPRAPDWSGVWTMESK
jgi:adenylate cyclase